MKIAYLFKQFCIILLTLSCFNSWAVSLSTESQQQVKQLEQFIQDQLSTIALDAQQKNIDLSNFTLESHIPLQDSSRAGIIFQQQSQGIQLLTLSPNGAAEKSGLTPGQIITHINGVAVKQLEQKRISYLLNRLSFQDKLNISLKGQEQPVTLDMSQSFDFIPAHKIAFNHSEFIPENASKGVIGVEQSYRNEIKKIENAVNSTLRIIAEVEKKNGYSLRHLDLLLNIENDSGLNSQITIGSDTDSMWQLPKDEFFADGRLPTLSACGDEDCRLFRYSYSIVRNRPLSHWRTAQFMLNGYGTRKDPVALNLIQQIAKTTQLPYANYLYGQAILEQFPLEAIIYLKRAIASDSPDPEALTLLANIYAEGKVAKANPQLAKQLLSKAEESHKREFKLSLNDYLTRELDLNAPNALAAIKSRKEKFIAKPRNKIIMLRKFPYLIMDNLPYCQTKKCKKHFQSYRALNRANFYLTSTMRIAEMYYAGYGTEVSLEKSRKLFKVAADANVQYAQFMYAKISFELGNRLDTAKTFLKKAADKEHYDSMLLLAMHNDMGIHIDQNKALARALREKAAQRQFAINPDYSGRLRRAVETFIYYVIDLDHYLPIEVEVLRKQNIDWYDRLDQL